MQAKRLSSIRISSVKLHPGVDIGNQFIGMVQKLDAGLPSIMMGGVSDTVIPGTDGTS
jgi:uncharacterized protein YwlG (UPF0340 family)